MHVELYIKTRSFFAKIFRHFHKEKLYPWGDRWEVGRSNLWQGQFPIENQERDKFYGISPVDAFRPQNDYQMHDMIGNVWEWTSTM